MLQKEGAQHSAQWQERPEAPSLPDQVTGLGMKDTTKKKNSWVQP
jgi:hypothetical protein